MAELKNRKALENRYDFVYVFDVKDGNPNGDPDAGNLPRVDAETGQGIVTDVCLKRKVRNFVELTKNEQDKDNFKIYIKEKAVLGKFHIEAFENLNIKLGEEIRKEIPDDLKDELENYVLPEGMYTENEPCEECDGEKRENPEGMGIKTENEKQFLVVASNANKEAIKNYIKELKPTKKLSEFLNKIVKDARPRTPTSEETDKGKSWMCENFYDIRAFGAVMSLKSVPNCGQVRGPIQFTFARSVDPIVISEHSITRMAVATEKEAKEQSGDNRTMGRKSTVPYGLYVAYGFVSAPLAKQTGFTEDDLELFWEALINMFENDRSAARGLMSARKLYVFKHRDKLGNAPADKLFDLVKLKIRKNDAATVARNFSDYNLPQKEEIEKGIKKVLAEYSRTGAQRKEEEIEKVLDENIITLEEKI
ncbi:MAG: type I-C CRISPR-associated protein Cas7/Csd2 [Endomicrobium sp.]|uniref:type I-C CRISPR-associated protein Cas7/Csd2 n=1 Tax=Candidatus Endomicrobiellum pyrsonymphae TaxID=1408203 RepID=UPI0035854CB6|nr:type I-C CRISPR-associated protein Cas7/Csd2 [Endomicrobium sp.]